MRRSILRQISQLGVRPWRDERHLDALLHRTATTSTTIRIEWRKRTIHKTANISLPRTVTAGRESPLSDKFPLKHRHRERSERIKAPLATEGLCLRKTLRCFGNSGSDITLCGSPERNDTRARNNNADDADDNFSGVTSEDESTHRCIIDV